MNKIETGKDIESKIEAEIKALNGKMDERYALAWHGYLACAQEWGLIDHHIYGDLINLLPKLKEPDPIRTIFMGRDDD